MTVVDPDPARPTADLTPLDTLRAVCPYLAAADGTWRSTSAAREHRCHAVAPPAPLATEKQKRLCLTAEHSGCATFEAAQASRSAGHEREHVLTRLVARTTPVVLDRGRLAIVAPQLRTDRRSGQTVLIGILAVAFAALLLGRLTGGGAAIASESPSADPSGGASAIASVAVATASPSLVVESTPGASPSATVGQTPRPTATGSRTYKVKRGDSLLAIAAKFETTAANIRKLNGLAKGSTLSVGQVLQIP